MDNVSLINPARARAMIHLLIDYLDSLETDPDMEPDNDDESYLAGDMFSTGSMIDMELDDADLEPWLGWTSNTDQDSRDWRGDGEDLEPDSDAEYWFQPAELLSREHAA